MRLHGDDGALELEVSDDGAGFDPAAPGVRSRRLGLTSMEERAGGSAAGWRSARRRAPARRSGWRRRCLSRSACSWSTTTRSCARACATFLDLQDGIEVVGEAADGDEAVAAAERLAPDVVLMDLVMPRLDGVGAMRGLRERVRARA